MTDRIRQLHVDSTSEELSPEVGHQVKDVERQPAKREHQSYPSQQKIGFTLTSAPSFVFLFLERCRRRGGEVLCDHAVSELVADAQVRHAEDEEGQDILHDHLGHAVGALLDLQGHVLQTHVHVDVWHFRQRLTTVDHGEEKGGASYEEGDEPDGDEGDGSADFFHAVFGWVDDHLQCSREESFKVTNDMFCTVNDLAALVL